MRAARGATLLLVCLATLACQEPPPGKVHADPTTSEQPREDRAELTREAHREAMARLIEDAIGPLERADPIGAATIGRGSLGLPPLALGDRSAVQGVFDPIWAQANEIDESALEPADVIVLRTIRFALGRMHDDLVRRPKLRSEPLVAVRAIEELVDALLGSSLSGSCSDCARAFEEVARVLPSVDQQLAEASLAQAEHARRRTLALIERLDAVGSRPGIGGPALDKAKAALREHEARLATLIASLPDAPVGDWTSTSSGPRPAGIRRLPDVLGERALVRMLGSEERLDEPPARLWALTKAHVRRWTTMRAELVGPEPIVDPPGPVDLQRCSAALDRLRTGLAAIPEIRPPELDCQTWLAIRGDRARSEGELVLELLDDAVIEPQRRALRAQELPTIALIRGQWSGEVHRHLRRVMLLARLDERAAKARALDEGRRALCLASAALWIHARLGPADEVQLVLGPECADLGSAQEVTQMVLGDPRGALTGLGLALIGDEPAAMAGFERFWWAPLGLMRTLATPPGMHPDAHELPSEQTSEGSDVGVDPSMKIQVEELSAETEGARAP